jgi:hypothetical protein
MGEEAIQANFSGNAKATAHVSGGDGNDDLASAQRHYDKRARDKKRHGEEMVVAAEHAAQP